MWVTLEDHDYNANSAKSRHVVEINELSDVKIVVDNDDF